MENVIKFRAWDKQKKEWLNPTLFGVLGSGSAVHYDGMWRILNLEKVEISQFTGLLDKNQKEIYEGDVIKTDAEHFSHVFVDWCEYTAGLITWQNSGFFVCQQFIGANELSNYTACDCCPSGLEIIGNIYENPELLTD